MNGISGIGSNTSMMQGMSGMNRPDPAAMAQNLFSALDESGQGYLEKTDLQAAFEKVTSTSSSSSIYSDDSDIDELFTQLDTDGDGKITEQEFTDSLAKIDAQINNLFANMRMNEAMGDMPPPPPGEMPPPPPTNDEGFTLEELSSQLEEIGDTDSTRSSFISNIIDNFDEADADGDGKVTLNEAINFNKNSTSTNTSSTDASSTVTVSSAEDDLNAKVLLQIMRLVQAYAPDNGAENTSSSSLSVSA